MTGAYSAVPRKGFRGTAFAFWAVATAMLVGWCARIDAQTTARILDLPLYEPEKGRTTLPAYHPRKIILELGPKVARPGLGLSSAPDMAPPLIVTSGIPGLDAVARSHGVAGLEPMFPGEQRPAPGSKLEDLTRFYIVYLPEGGSLASALADFEALPEVVTAEPVGIMPLSFTPNDPMRNQQFQLGQPNDRDSDVYEAWDVNQGDTTIVVAIVDTGVLYNHSDLGGGAPYTGGNIWTNYLEMGGVAGVDDDGNGFIDDFRGWDFVTSQAGTPGEDLGTPDNDPSDFNGHGTFCSGMASARTNNGVGIAGTAFRCKIMALRSGWDTASGGAVDMGASAQAINYAANKGANVINCSWESNNLAGLGAAVTNALARGITICVAAGNANQSSTGANYLASRGDCVDVAATDSNDLRASFTNWGEWIDVSAAGDNVTSTSSFHYSPTYGTGSGTSFSSPFTAGAVALYQSYRRSLGQPLLPPDKMILRLRDTGDNIDALNPAYAGYLGSRLNVHRLLTAPPGSWINALAGAVTTSPVIADLDGDGDDEIVVGGSDQKVLAVGAALGDTIPGWPVTLIGSVIASPAAWDVDLDGRPEIIVGTNQGWLYALKHDGTNAPGWPVQLSGAIYGSPAISDLLPAPGLELAVGTTGSKVYVLARDGTVQPGWPVSTGGEVRASPSLHDLDGDGNHEIVVGALDSTVYVWRGNGTTFPGWPRHTGDIVLASAAIGDVDRDGAPDIVVGSYDQKIYGWRANGTAMAGWPVTVAGSVRGAAALVDLTGNDGWLEAIVISDGPTVYVLQNDGSFAPGWPKALGGQAPGGPLIADIDGDGGLNVLAFASDRRLYIYNANGTEKLGWPKPYEGYAAGGGSIADADRDGQVEIYFGSDVLRRLRCVDMGPGSYNPQRMPWPTPKGDYLRRGSVSSVVLASDPTPGPGVSSLSFTAAPNPARGAIRLALRRGSAANGALEVRVVSVSGREVRRLRAGAPGGLESSVVWDGRDEAGRLVPAGLYLASASWGEETAVQRIVRLP